MKPFLLTLSFSHSTNTPTHSLNDREWNRMSNSMAQSLISLHPITSLISLQLRDLSIHTIHHAIHTTAMSNIADTDSTNTSPSPSQSHREVFNLSSVKWFYSFALDIPRVSRVLGGYVEGDKEWRRGAMKAIRGAESTEELRRRIKSFHVKMERKTSK